MDTKKRKMVVVGWSVIVIINVFFAVVAPTTIQRVIALTFVVIGLGAIAANAARLRDK